MGPLAVWLPRSGVGASAGAPASRRPTGRGSARSTLPRGSVGARRAPAPSCCPLAPTLRRGSKCGRSCVQPADRTRERPPDTPTRERGSEKSPRAVVLPSGSHAPAWEQVRALLRPAGRPDAGAPARHSHAGAWEREEPPRPSRCPLAPTLRRGSKCGRSCVQPADWTRERPLDTPTLERGSEKSVRARREAKSAGARGAAVPGWKPPRLRPGRFQPGPATPACLPDGAARYLPRPGGEDPRDSRKPMRSRR